MAKRFAILVVVIVLSLLAAMATANPTHTDAQQVTNDVGNAADAQIGQATPEPATVVLLVGGLAVSGLKRIRRRASK